MYIDKAIEPDYKPNRVLAIYDAVRSRFKNGGLSLDQQIINLEEVLNSLRGISNLSGMEGYWIEQMEQELKDLKGMRKAKE